MPLNTAVPANLFYVVINNDSSILYPNLFQQALESLLKYFINLYYCNFMIINNLILLNEKKSFVYFSLNIIEIFMETPVFI